MEAGRRIIRILQGAGFKPGAFDAKVLLDCDLDQVITAIRSLFKALVPLADNYDSADQELTTTVKFKEKEHPLAVSSHYASAESDAEEIDDMEIKRMLLGPSGSAFLRDHHEHTAPTTRAMDSTTTQVPATDKSD